MRARLDWIQVELTTRCDAACAYCPHTAYSDRWMARNMERDTVAGLLPVLRRAGFVHLQGWGEPLLHPDTLELIRLLKQHGCTVYTLINGNRMTARLAEQLVEAQLDVLGVSLAGTVAETQDGWRKGTTLERAVGAIRRVAKAKTRLGSELPRLHVAYMLLRSGIAEMTELPRLLAGLPVDQVVVSSLSLVTRPELAREGRLADTVEEWNELRQRLVKLRSVAGASGLDLRYHLVAPFAVPGTCSENIQHSAFVGVDGSVFPCVFTGLPVSKDVTTHDFEGPQRIGRLPFGNLHDSSFQEIWRNESSRRFRRQHRRGHWEEPCLSCPKRRLETFETALANTSGSPFLGSFPELA